MIDSESDFYNNNVNIIISGCKIKNVKQEKHLGHTFQNSRNIIEQKNPDRNVFWEINGNIHLFNTNGLLKAIVFSTLSHTPLLLRLNKDKK